MTLVVNNGQNENSKHLMGYAAYKLFLIFQLQDTKTARKGQSSLLSNHCVWVSVCLSVTGDLNGNVEKIQFL